MSVVKNITSAQENLTQLKKKKGTNVCYICCENLNSSPSNSDKWDFIFVIVYYVEIFVLHACYAGEFCTFPHSYLNTFSRYG